MTRRRIDGSVLRLVCGACQTATVDFIFRGDVDYATEGLVSFTSVERDELVLAELPAGLDDASVERFLAELSARLGRDDLRYLRPDYRDNRLTYQCPQCGARELRPGRELSTAAYRRSGGVVTRV